MLGREHFPGLLNIVSDLVWSFSLDGQRLLYINPAAANIYDRPQADLMSQPGIWMESVHHDDQDLLKENLANIKTSVQFNQRFRIIQPDGTQRWLLGFFCLVFDNQGNPEFIGGTANDVTSRMQAEQKFEESQAIYDSLVESLPINVFRKDREGKIVFANGRLCKELNRSLEELIGLGDYDLFDKDLATKYKKDDEWVLQTGLPFHDIEEHPKEDGASYVEVLKAPVTDKRGRRIGIQGMFWDVTDRRKAEEALRRAKDLAVSASQAKSDFLANVSHEIRTPMNGIIGMTDLLLGSVANKEHREYLDLIQGSAQSLLKLINNILDFSKIESGKVQLESHRFNLRDTLGDTLRSLAIRVHAKDLELVVDISPDVPAEIVGDLTRLRQVIVNLVSNATKFTKTGMVKVVIEKAGFRADKVKLRFRVIDSGIGIPAEKQDLIFCEFEQADTSTTRKYGGTGLGLAIASRIVALMGGQLQVVSEPGKGSEFFFAAEFNFDPTDFVEPPELLARQTALLVMKHPEMLANLTKTLQTWKVKTFAAATAKEAFKLLQDMAHADTPIPLIITDIELPEFDGPTLAGWIRDEPSIENTHIIFLASTKPSSTTIDRGILGIDDQLLKPVKEEDLFQSIAVVLKLMEPESAILKKNDAREIPLSPLNILLAEDNLVNQKLAVALLKKKGHRVVVANNGQEAIDYFETRAFDVILMDIQMPEVDGFEATMAIRKLQSQHLPRVPIIALTAHASPDDRKRCLAAGMDEYISKPFRASELYELIENQTGFRSETAPLPDGENPAPTKLVDWGRAFETVGGDHQLLRELIKVFLKDREMLVGNIRAAIESNNDKELRLSAHSIKGALNHLGARDAAILATKLETLGANNEAAKSKEIFRDFAQSLVPLTAEMLQFVRGK